jgi:DNA polymerase-3 subunit alpha
MTKSVGETPKGRTFLLSRSFAFPLSRRESPFVSGSGFAHLHVHTHYSLLDGATRIAALVARAKEQGSPAVAITDHGNMFGAVEFYAAAVKAGIKPIVGCEVYVAPGDRRSREPCAISEASYHLLLLAQNLTGYHNLLKLTSRAYREGFYYRPRVDKELLREHSEGIIATSTCLGGEIPQSFLAHNRAAAEDAAKTYLEIFGPDRFFIEIQDHGLKEQKEINPELAELAQRLGLGLIATNDVHYLDHDDAGAHDVLCCISTGKKLEDKERFRFETDQFYLKSPEEMQALFADFPDALANTLRVADLCNLELDFSKVHAPVYAPPEGRKPEDYLRELVYKGAESRYPEITDEIRERIDYELGVIARKGFSSYFLIVWDVVEFARREGIPVGARGSACSSVVGHCLGISAPEPIRYGLYFERFLDPDRDERPDIDLDICQERRQEIIEYVRGKYGHVAQIITFGTLKARAAVKDVSRVMGLGFDDANKLSQLIPAELKMTIDKALDTEPELRRRYEQEDSVRKVIDVAKRLEGLARHAGVHAAGVVIAERPLDDLIPLYKPPDEDQIVTQFDGTTVEKVGLMKMDFLGLETLTIMERARQLVKKHHGIELDLQRLDLADQRVYDLFTRGDTKGVFQFESGGMRDVLMKMRPNRIEDLIAANALFRPGPMVNIEAYNARKHGERWTTPHPIMTDVLAETFGIMVYQEQVSRLVNRLGNIELKRAFRLAKAISKKKTQMIDAEREPFIAGAMANGVKKDTANQIFEDILRFGGYAFNKAHSTGYALVAFQTAYLKTYYPVEFMAALLTCEKNDTKKLPEYIDECRHMGISIKPPDINTSELDFTIVRDSQGKAAIRFGLGGIKGVGEKAVASILGARRSGGAFRSLFDFCERVDLQLVNKGVLEALIKCGAFDSTGAMRKGLMSVLDKAIQGGSSVQSDRQSGQMSFFDALGAGPAAPAEPRIPNEEWSEAEMLAHERATIGFYVTSHPLAQQADRIEKYATVRTVDLVRYRDKDEVTLGGMITKLRTVITKNGRNAGSKMGIISVEDLSGQVEVVVFPSDLDRLRAFIVPDRVAFFQGEVDRRREEPSLRVSDIIPIEEADERLATALLLRVRCATANEDLLQKICEVLAEHKGDRPVYVEMITPSALRVTIRCNGRTGITPTPACVSALADLLGTDSVIILGPVRAAAPPMVAAPTTAPSAPTAEPEHRTIDDEDESLV